MTNLKHAIFDEQQQKIFVDKVSDVYRELGWEVLSEPKPLPEHATRTLPYFIYVCKEYTSNIYPPRGFDPRKMASFNESIVRAVREDMQNAATS